MPHPVLTAHLSPFSFPAASAQTTRSGGPRMYTLLLMTAMSGAPQTAEFNGFFRDLFSFNGCHGSCTGCYGSCSGQSSGCYGSCNGNCNGCGGFGSRLRAFFTG